MSDKTSLLVVDDEAALMATLRDLLSGRGFTVHGVTSGEAALDALRENSYDLLLSDLMMPGMNGIEVLRRALEMDADLVTIVMTGQGSIESAVEAMRLGAFDYLEKPFKLAAVLPVLQRATEVRRLRLENVRLRTTAALHELTQAIAFTPDIETLLRKVSEAMMQQCEADEVSIMLPTADGQELVVAMTSGEGRRHLHGERVPLGQGIAGWVAEHGEPVTLHGVVEDERFAGLYPRDDITSAMILPLISAGKLLGVISINSTHRKRPFSKGQANAASLLAGSIAPVLENAALMVQVREAELKYRGIFENAVDGIYQTSPDGRYLTANPALVRLYGYDSADDLIANVVNIKEQLYVDPARREEFRRLLAENGVVTGFEAQVFRKDRSVIWISENARAVRDDAGKLLRYDGTVEDITPRKLAEEALRVSESNYRLLFENSPYCIHEIDLEGRLMSMNRVGLSMMGVSEELEICGLPYLSAVADKDTERIGRLQQLAFQGQPSEFEFEANNGFIFQSSFVPITNAQGAVARLMGLTQDITERKKAESANELFRAQVERVNDAIEVVDPDTGRFLEMNEKGCLDLGYTRDEILALTVCDVNPTMDAEAFAQRMVELRQKGTLSRETVHRRKNGTTFPVEVNIKLVHLDRDYAVTVARDITDRKWAEDKLRESEEQYRLLADNTDDFVMLSDADGRRLYVSPSFFRRTGWTRDELERTDFHSRLHPDDVALVERTHVDNLNGKRTVIEHRVRTKGGAWIWVENRCKPFLNAEGKVTHLVQWSRDITGRRLAEDELHASEERFKAFMDNTPAFVFIKDHEGRYVYVNESVEWLVDTPLAELIGKTNYDRLPEETAKQLRENDMLVLRTGQSQLFEETLPAPDGSWHHQLVVKFPLTGAKGERLLAGVAVDITERKRAEEALQRVNDELEGRVEERTAELALAKQEAEKANLAKSEFLSRMSHELRTPLNAILGFGQLLEFGEFDEKEAAAVQQILKGGRHLLELINEVLDIARIESGHLSLSPEAVPLALTIREVLEMVRPLAGARQIHISHNCAEVNNHHVLADQQRFRQVLLNLLSNAIKYNRDEGRVDIECRMVNPSSCQIRISDTGPGLTPAELAKLFIPFERLGAAQSTIEGTGIGLVLCKRLAEAMGGDIGVESTAGAGSVFWIQLPLAKAQLGEVTDATPAPQAPDKVETPGGTQHTVLYIEDNLSNLSLIESLMKRQEGVRMLTAIQGSIGLELAKLHRPDVILLDLHLPDMHGEVVLARLRSDPDTQKIPVVVLSADAMPGEIAKLRAAGIVDYLTKPLNLRHLLQVLENILQGKPE